MGLSTTPRGEDGGDAQSSPNRGTEPPAASGEQEEENANLVENCHKENRELYEKYVAVR